MNDPFEHFPVIQTERLLLRSLTMDDIPAMQEITSYEGIKATSPETARLMFEKIFLNYKNRQSINWGIVLKKENVITGTCGFYRGFADNTGEIGYILREEFRNKGILSEAAKAITRFGFDTLQLKCIKAYTMRSNLPSVAVLTKLGFKETGTLKDYTEFSLWP